MAFLVVGIAHQIDGRDTCRFKILRHEFGMLDGNTESQSLHRIHVCCVLVQGLDNMVRPAFCDIAVERIQIGQLALVVTAPRPAQVVQVNGVRNAEILEGAQELPLDGLRQTNLSSTSSTEIIQNTPSVHTFRRSCQTQKDLRLEVVQELLISRRSGVVEFVHHNVVIVICRQTVIKSLGVKGLHRNKQVIQVLRPIATNKELTEIRIFQHALEGIPALLQDFFPVGHEQ